MLLRLQGECRAGFGCINGFRPRTSEAATVADEDRAATMEVEEETVEVMVVMVMEEETVEVIVGEVAVEEPVEGMLEVTLG